MNEKLKQLEKQILEAQERLDNASNDSLLKFIKDNKKEEEKKEEKEENNKE